MQSVFPPDDPGDPPLLLLNLGRDLLCLILSRTGELDILAIVLACKEIRAAAISNGQFPQETPVAACITSVARVKWAIDWCPWLMRKNSQPCAKAASLGKLDVCRYLREELDFPWGELTCAEAAGHGHLDVLRYARSHSCPWSEGTTKRAARGGHLHVLEYVKEQYEAGETNGRRPWTSGTCADAAEGGHLAVLKFLVGEGCKLEADLTWRCARGGHLAVLEWCRLQTPPCPWDGRACAEAAKANHLAVLQWLHANGCPWTHSTCSGAALKGNLAILQWARSQVPACPWIAATAAAAASGEKRDLALTVLKWLRAGGCPWDGGTGIAAAKAGDAAMLEWIIDHGGPVSKATVQAAATAGQRETLKILKAKCGQAEWWPENQLLATWTRLSPDILDGLADALSHAVVLA